MDPTTYVHSYVITRSFLAKLFNFSRFSNLLYTKSTRYKNPVDGNALLENDVCFPCFIYENENGRTEGNVVHETASHITYSTLLPAMVTAPPIVYFS